MSAAAEDLELLTIPQLAKLGKVHRSTVYRHRDEGRVEFVYMGPRSPRVTRAEAERYLSGLAGYHVDVTDIRRPRRDH
jgi:excisionase family DNA binding protein